MLRCLCQPPPPGMEPTKDANKLGVQGPPPKYRGIIRGTRAITYNDGADLALIVAAGWMMASPSNYWMHRAYVNQKGSGGTSVFRAVLECFGGLDADIFAGDGDDGGDGGGCGGCGGGDGGGCGGCGGGDGGGGCGGGCGGGGD